MTSQWFARDMQEPILIQQNKSYPVQFPVQSNKQQESGKQLITDTQKVQKNYVLCQLCCKYFLTKFMYSIVDTDEQQCGHLFCMDCLTKRLEYCIINNQQIYCPIDACPYTMNTTSKFFNNLQAVFQQKYESWKQSYKYKNRNLSIRMSFAESSFLLQQSIGGDNIDKKLHNKQSFRDQQKLAIKQQQQQDKLGRVNLLSSENLEQILLEQRQNKRQANNRRHHRHGHTLSTVICKILLMIVIIPFLVLQFVVSVFLTIAVVAVVLVSLSGVFYCVITFVYSCIDQQYDRMIFQGAGFIVCLIISILSIWKRQVMYNGTIKVIWKTWYAKVRNIYYYPQKDPKLL